MLCSCISRNMANLLIDLCTWQKRREGNGRESIQLFHTFRQRHQRERNTNTKYLDPIGNITNKKPNGQILPTKWQNGYPETKRSKRHTHSKTNYNKNKPQQEPPWNTRWGGGGGGGGGCRGRNENTENQLITEMKQR